MPGLDPGIHLSRRRWIAGSSPAMTTEQANAPPARVLSGDGCACLFLPRKISEGAERRQAHQQCHACEARRASCAVDKFTQSAQTSTRHARLSALHRGDFGRRDCSNHHPDRPFGLLIPQASACVRPGAIYQLWRALVVGPGSTPRLPEMACETIRRRRTRSANQDASRWRPRMSRQQQDTERREEKSLHAGDMRG
jgi:hypothetical protein